MSIGGHDWNMAKPERRSTIGSSADVLADAQAAAEEGGGAYVAPTQARLPAGGARAMVAKKRSSLWSVGI